ncbi:MAG: glucosamine-6-phosphate deaminase [Planctomycetota bacterium]|nr:MAG: glucosamine-6-phosphate deaminase [Planctomycetota bacterium]
MEVVICSTYEDLSKKAAKAIADLVRAKPNAVLGGATGSSPVGLYKELIRMHKEEGLDFSKVTTFNLDEYVSLAPDHPQSYHYFMFDQLFGHINVPPENVHVPSGISEDHEAFCARYEQQIKEAGGIDIQILGLGSDGHIAFNEPGSSLASRTRLVTLAEQTIEDNARFFDKKEDVPVHAISMGVGTILEARKLLMVVNGKNKASALADALEGPVTCICTASALQLHPDSIVFADEEAASQLKMRDYYNWVQKLKAEQLSKVCER